MAKSKKENKKTVAKKAVPVKKTIAKTPAKKSVPAKKVVAKAVPAKKVVAKAVPAKKVVAKAVPAKKVAPVKNVEPPLVPEIKTIAVPREIKTPKLSLNMCSRRAYSPMELVALLDLVGTQTFKLYNPDDADLEAGSNDKVTVLMTLPKAKKTDKVIGPASIKDLFGGIDPFSKTAQQDEEKLIPAKWRGLYKELLDLRKNNQQLLEIYKSKLNSQESKEETGDFTALGDHTADIDTEAFDRDVAIARIEKVKFALTEISAAINRMKTGKYGIDEVTGKPIAMERLKKMPYARRGAEEQRKTEREQAQNARKMHAATVQDMLGSDIETRLSDDSDIPNKKEKMLDEDIID